MKHTRRILNYAGLAVSVIAVVYAFWGINWHTVSEQIRYIHLAWYSSTMVLMVLSIYVRALRWKYIIKPLGQTRVYPLYKSVMIGYFGNNVLPFRLGELLRAYVAARFTGIGTVKLVPTVVADRFLDLLAFFAVFLIMSFGAALPDWAGKTRYYLLIVILLLIILLVFYRRNSYRITLYLSEKTSPVSKMLKEFHLSLAALFKMDDYWKIISTSLFLWLIYGCHYFIGFQAFGFHLSVADAALVLAASTFAVSIPSAPGSLGTYHSGLIAILTFLSVDKSQALAFAVMMHLAGFIPITFLGTIYFFRSGISLREVKNN